MFPVVAAASNCCQYALEKVGNKSQKHSDKVFQKFIFSFKYYLSLKNCSLPFSLLTIDLLIYKNVLLFKT